MNTDIVKLVEEQELSLDTSHGIYRGLFEYFMGQGPKTECLKRHVSDSTYYRWRDSHPEVINEIEKVAKTAAFLEQEGDNMAFRAEQLQQSREIQLSAMKKLKDTGIIDTMADVALGVIRTIDMGEDRDPKVVVPYPRDQVEAVRRLQELARGGVLPEHMGDSYEFLQRLMYSPDEKEEEVEEEVLTLQHLGLGITPEFTKITAQTADGTTYTASVEKPSIVEGEVNEV